MIFNCMRHHNYPYDNITNDHVINCNCTDPPPFSLVIPTNQTVIKLLRYIYHSVNCREAAQWDSLDGGLTPQNFCGDPLTKGAPES